MYRRMTLFKLDPGPPSAMIAALCNRVTDEYSLLVRAILPFHSLLIYVDCYRLFVESKRLYKAVLITMLAKNMKCQHFHGSQ